jgi:hypothetical protein
VVDHDLELIARQTKARVDFDMFADLFKCRALGENIELAKAPEANFLTPASTVEERMAVDIRAFQASQATQWEAELFKQGT